MYPHHSYNKERHLPDDIFRGELTDSDDEYIREKQHAKEGNTQRKADTLFYNLVKRDSESIEKLRVIKFIHTLSKKILFIFGSRTYIQNFMETMEETLKFKTDLYDETEIEL